MDEILVSHPLLFVLQKKIILRNEIIMEIKFLIKNKMFEVVIFLVILMTVNGFSQEMAVPANLQAALFKKIFAFNKTLSAKGDFQVAVMGNSSADVVSAFKEAGVNAKAVSGEQIPSDVSVVYLMPGTTTTKQQSAANKVLSISGVASYAENGNVAISLGTEGGKPKIIINMTQLKAEGQEMSSELLKIAKIIQ